MRAISSLVTPCGGGQGVASVVEVVQAQLLHSALGAGPAPGPLERLEPERVPIDFGEEESTSADLDVGGQVGVEVGGIATVRVPRRLGRPDGFRVLTETVLDFVR